MRKSTEFTHNIRSNRKSLDKISCAHKLSILNNKGRNSLMNSLKHLKAKKDLERKKTNYYSNAKLNIITILSNCINENFCNELSFHEMKSEKSLVKSKVKKRKSRRSTMLKNIDVDILNSDKIKQTNLNGDFSPKNSRRSNSINATSDKALSEKRSYIQINKLGNSSCSSSSRYSKKSLVLPKMTHIKNKFTHNYNTQEKTFISPNKEKRTTFVNVKKNSFINNLSEIEKKKLDQNIFNDINLIQLKKKIAQVKKILKHKYNVNPEDNNLKRIITLQPVSNNSSVSENGTTIQKSTNSQILNKSDNFNNKFRRIVRKANLFDSIDDEEYSDEETGYYISPNCLFIKFHDFIMLFSSLFYFIIIPYFLSQNYFQVEDNNILILLLLFIDLMYIIDVIINCFRAYKNFDETIIKKTKKIFSHYLKNWLFVDLIQAFPYYSLLYFLKKKYNYCSSMLNILYMIKAIKLFTIEENNTLINYSSDLLSKSEIIDDNKSNVIILFIFLSFLNIATCLYIFLGRNTYTSWMIKLNIQDDHYLDIYITSLYFVIVTVTTVGYGDITGNTIPEVLFQMVLLILGTIVYSFILSYFSNYIVKISQKSINFKNKLEILNEIKVHHPKMSHAIYKEVLRNLKNEQFYEKKDKQLLFQNLPYYLKNILIMEMYKPIIKNFTFFKDIDNSDFIVKVATSLKPLISIKGDILIQEGDFIKEIFFVKHGVLGLNICINLKNPEHSIQKYYDLIDIDKEVSHIKTSILKLNGKRSLNTTSNNINTATNATNTTFLSIKDEEESSFIENSDKADYKDINIIEIRTNEHFGDALMFLNEKCPLKVRVRTKKAELLILKKMEAIEIYSIYPHIWKKNNKKSLYNMQQIYLKVERTLHELYNHYIKSTKSIISNEYKIVINKLHDNDEILNNNKKQNKNNSSLKYKSSEKSKVKHTRIENEKQLETNISRNAPYNNMTPYGMNNTINNNSLKPEESVKTGKKKTLFEKGINNKRENRLIEIAKKISNKNNISELETLQKNIKNGLENYDFHIDIENNNNIIINYQKQFLFLNSGFSENSIEKKNVDNKTLKKSLTSNALISKYKRTPNKFVNLTSTKENSIHLNCSYENINKISNYKYINNINLQNRIKKVIDDECSKKNIPSIFNNNKGKSLLIKEFELTMSSKMENESESELSYRRTNNIYSQRNSPVRSKKKIVNKQFIGKRLNTISKNIKNANDVINNPNEFYMNFFNNIIQNDPKSKKTRFYFSQALSGFNTVTDNARKNQRNSNIEHKQFDTKPTFKKDG